MEEPEYSFPLPSPQPSRDLLEGSWGLDLTPERQLKPRERLRKLKNTARIDSTGPNEPKLAEDVLPTVPPVSALSMPQLNSTAQLCNRIHQLKQQGRKPRSVLGSLEFSTSQSVTTTNRKLPSPAQLSAIKENVADLEGIMNHKPIKEVNIPRHTSRYSNLVPVEVSDESFQKLTTVPKKRNKSSTKSNKSKQDSSQETGCDAEEPSIMEFFSPDLEWEEAEWTLNTNCYSHRDSLDVPGDAPFTLYAHMQHTWY